MVKRIIRRLSAYLVLSVLIIGLLAGTGVNSAQAATGYAAYTVASVVKIHTGAGTRYRSVGTYYKYQTMTIKGSRGNWKMITYGGHTRYVWGPSVRAGLPRIRSYVIPASAWMRYGPGLKFGRVRYVYQNYYVTIYSRSGGWYHVNYRGRYGYVWAGSIREGIPPFNAYNGYVNVSQLYLRTDPGLIYPNQQTLYKNNNVTVIGKSGNWLRLKVGSKTGYSWGPSVSAGNPPAASAVPASFNPSTGSYGLDISNHQNSAGAVYFNQIKSSGYNFVIIKASEGNYYQDPYFKSNADGAAAAGLKVAAYHFFRAGDQSDAKAEADYFINTLGAAGYNASNIGYVFLDVETNDSKLSKADLTNNVIAFFNEMKARGFNKLGVYSYLYFFNDNLDLNSIKAAQQQSQRFLIWMAAYHDVNQGPNANFPVDIWQYSSSGQVNGIVGKVDQDISYFNPNDM